MNDKDVKERTIAIIPARGGSKRIKKKYTKFLWNPHIIIFNKSSIK